MGILLFVVGVCTCILNFAFSIEIVSETVVAFVVGRYYRVLCAC